MTRFLVGFGLGMLAFSVLHGIEVAMWTRWFGSIHTPWFLNSGRAGLFMLIGLFVVSLVATYVGISVSGLVTGAIVGMVGGLVAGAIVDMTIILFLSPGGPGTIFPIVLVFGSVLVVISVVAGWAVGLALALIRRRAA